jgi:hypothetical protein
MRRVLLASTALLSLITISLVLAEAAPPADAETAESIIEQIIQYRRALDPAYIQLESSMWSLEEGELRQRNRVEYRFHIKGTALSMERSTYLHTRSGQEQHLLTEILIRDPDQTLITMQLPPDGKQVLPSVFQSGVDARLSSSIPRIWDPRSLGLANAPFPTHHNYPQQDQWEAALLGPAQLRQSVRLKQNAIVSTLSHGTNTVNFSSNHNLLPVRCEFQGKDGSLVNTVIDLHNWSQSDDVEHWFPRRASYTRSDSSRKVVERNECIVQRAEFGIPIPDSKFSVAALNLEPRQSVRLASPDNPFGLATWTGSELRTSQYPKANLEAEYANRPQNFENSRFTTLLYLNSAVLAALGIILLWRRKQHKRNTDLRS